MFSLLLKELILYFIFWLESDFSLQSCVPLCIEKSRICPCLIDSDFTTLTPIHYTVNFMAVKIDNYQLKKYDVFLIFALNIDC